MIKQKFSSKLIIKEEYWPIKWTQTIMFIFWIPSISLKLDYLKTELRLMFCPYNYDAQPVTIHFKKMIYFSIVSVLSVV